MVEREVKATYLPSEDIVVCVLKLSPCFPAESAETSSTWPVSMSLRKICWPVVIGATKFVEVESKATYLPSAETAVK